MAAQAVAVGHPLVVEDLPGLVRLVAVHAGRQHVGLLLPQLPLDDLPVHLLDAGVAALRAGAGDVGPRDGGARVGVREDVVRGVAGGAGGGDGQALPEEALGVHALGVVLEDVVLMDVPLPLDGGALLVALPADEGHAGREHGRAPVPHGEDVVPPVAVLAPRRQRVPPGEGLPVEGLRVERLLVLVAGAAGDLREGGVRVGELRALEVRVACDAGDLPVDGGGQGPGVHPERDLLPLPLHDEVLLPVALEAVPVLLGEGRGREARERRPEGGQGQGGARERPGRHGR